MGRSKQCIPTYIFSYTMTLFKISTNSHIIQTEGHRLQPKMTLYQYLTFDGEISNFVPCRKQFMVPSSDKIDRLGLC